MRQAYLDEAHTEFWTCLVFQSDEQRDAFLKAVGWEAEDGGRFVSGTKVAKALGVSLPPGPRWREEGLEPDYAAMARNDKGPDEPGPCDADSSD